MASTYTPIESKVLGSATTGVSFITIPQTYTDLVLVMQVKASAGSNPIVQVGNSSVDTGSNYSTTWMTGNGSTATSSRQSNATSYLPDYNGYATTGDGCNIIVQFMNYSNSTTYKTFLSRANNAASGVDATVGLWRSSNPIAKIDISTGSANTFSIGSTFTLYGIKAA